MSSAPVLPLPAVGPGVQRLAERFLGRFPAEAPALRTIGHEAEYPVVHPDGRAADIAVLFPRLKERRPTLRPKFEGDLLVSLSDASVEYCAEVGRGTIEVITGPHRTLDEADAALRAARGPLEDACAAEGLRLLGYGIQPLTPGTPALMTPKQRYGVLLDVLGPTWLWFTPTASDQVHAAIGRAEVVPVTNLVHLLTPVLLAFCANSPIYEGAPSGFLSSREATMGQIHAGTARHGVPHAPDASPLDYVGRLCAHPLLMVKRDGQMVPQDGRPFSAHVEARGGEDPTVLDDFLTHEHYVWNSARPRSAHGTLEIRPCCQQPLHEPLAAVTLGASMVMAAPALARLVERTFGDAAWAALSAWHPQAMAQGLAAPEPAPGFLAAVLDCCAEALAARGFGEDTHLEPLRHRLATRLNPAQRALQAHAAGGMAALVDHAART